MQKYVDELPDWARVLIPKAVAFLVSLLVTWLGSKGITITPTNEGAMITGGIAVAGGVFGLVKWWLNTHFNPANVSKPALAGRVHEDLKEEKLTKNG